MAFDGFGSFIRLRSWVADAVAGVKIRADFHDDEDNNLAAGLSQCIVKDGQTTITQNIPFNSKRVIALADPVDPQDAATKAYADTKASLTGTVPFTGDVTIKETSPSLTLDGSVGSKNSIYGQKADKNRWEIVLGNATAESGSNVGSDFQLINYADDGTLIGDVLFGSRSTGLLTVKANPTAALGIATKQYTDTGVATATAAANNRVLRAGDTMTGNLTAPLVISPSGGTTVRIGGIGNFAGFTMFYDPTDGATLQSWSGSGSTFWPMVLVASRISVLTGDFWLHAGANRWQQDGVMVVATQGYKPGGGSWADSSDARIKTVRAEYSHGLDVINQLQPVRYAFRGNAALIGTETSMHATVLDKEYIGLVAQDVEQIMPELVTQAAGYIDGQPVNDLRMLDPSPLIYALINAVNELSDKVEALETKANK